MAATAEDTTGEKASTGLSKTISKLLWTPPWLRWNPERNFEMSWPLTCVFGFVAAFSVANLYYTHPILHIIAEDFGITDERASLVPTVLQAGYATGLLFIVPVGDIVRRRPMIISLVFVTSLFWLGCTLTKTFESFLGLSYVVGLFTVTPQLMFPLTVRYAPARHRPTMTAIVMSGLVFGILVARLLSGIVTEYTNWRNIYWMSFGLQLAIVLIAFFLLPDFPVLRPGASYPSILVKMVKLPFQHPVLTQSALISFLLMGMFTSFWTTLTFQLAGPPFHLSTLVIGLFALVGMSPVLFSPIFSRLVMTRLHPSGTLIIGHIILLAAVCIGTFTGTFSLAGPVIWASIGDLGMNIVTVSNRMAFANVEPTAQNSVNSVYMVFTFCGQLFGTAVGNKLYASGGWIRSGSLSIGLIGGGLLLVLIRGPHETGWIGWSGGWELRTKVLRAREAANSQEVSESTEHPSDEEAAVPQETEVKEKI
ncbi:Major facilitator superfamily transporter [Trichoderma simmonsii]|uniref:Major facilitator superfamily transporter n=1 Tax=Trichoderma simmonsii TaxID=1491479 RepID=A0A8G0LQ05_9HYPO|nr:Major facilitator superfamily transporter [Trichoderma simmonsii]